MLISIWYFRTGYGAADGVITRANSACASSPSACHMIIRASHSPGWPPYQACSLNARKFLYVPLWLEAVSSLRKIWARIATSKVKWRKYMTFISGADTELRFLLKWKSLLRFDFYERASLRNKKNATFIYFTLHLPWACLFFIPLL